MRLPTILTILPLAALFLGFYLPGDKVEDFALSDVRSGKEVSLHSFSEAKAVILIFHSTVCPYSRLIEKRISQLQKEYTDRGAVLLLVNPNTNSPDEKGLDFRAYTQKHELLMAYLPDPGALLATKFGVTKTPECFLIQPTESGFILRYKGALDNNIQSEAAVTETYLENALKAVLAGSSVVRKETRTVGCMIKP